MITDRRDKHESQPDLNFGFAVLYNENSSTVVSQSYVMNIRKYVYEEWDTRMLGMPYTSRYILRECFNSCT